MKVMTWNIEWMNNWFVGYDEVAFRESYESTYAPQDSIPDVDALCRRVAQVITDVWPDVLCVQEGPSDPREMELFISTYLADDSGQSLYRHFGGYDGGAQKGYILVRQGGPIADAWEADDVATRAMSEEWDSDIEGDAVLQPYAFTRRPVVVNCLYEGQTVRIVAMHTKSKYVHNGEEMWNSPERRLDFVREALKQRRRISSEGMRARRYLDELLAEDPHQPIIVAGDCNDGPGADYFEEKYLTHNVSDILLGSTYAPALQFEHAFVHRMPHTRRFTAVFDDFVTGQQGRLLVLDHILVSPSMRSGGGSRIGLLNGGIAHDAFDRAVDPDATTARSRYPSDHRPAYAVFGP